jgi:hypothetical protein
MPPELRSWWRQLTRQRPVEVADDRHHQFAAEGAWANMKNGLGNLAARDVDQLAVIARNRLKHIQYRPALIEAFLAQTGLTLEPRPPREVRLLAFQALYYTAAPLGQERPGTARQLMSQAQAHQGPGNHRQQKARSTERKS